MSADGIDLRAWLFPVEASDAARAEFDAVPVSAWPSLSTYHAKLTTRAEPLPALLQRIRDDMERTRVKLNATVPATGRTADKHRRRIKVLRALEILYNPEPNFLYALTTLARQAYGLVTMKLPDEPVVSRDQYIPFLLTVHAHHAAMTDYLREVLEKSKKPDV